MPDIMRNIFTVLVLFFALLHLSAQDTLVFMDKTVEIVNFRGNSIVEVEYTLYSYPDGPVFRIEKEKLIEIRYLNGKSVIYNDTRYLFKKYKPSVYFVYGFLDGQCFDIVVFNEKCWIYWNYMGIGHEGVFNMMNANDYKLNVGVFYGINIHTGRISRSESYLYSLLNTCGWQLEYGKNANSRLVIQGMAGLNYTSYPGNNHGFGLSRGFSLMLKSYNSKFGIRALIHRYSFLNEHFEVVFRYGLEF